MPDDAEVKKVYTATMQAVRRKMSRLIRKNPSIGLIFRLSFRSM